MDERAVEAALSLDAAWVGQLRAAWLHLIDLGDLGDVRLRAARRVGPPAQTRAGDGRAAEEPRRPA